MDKYWVWLGQTCMQVNIKSLLVWHKRGNTSYKFFLPLLLNKVKLYSKYDQHIGADVDLSMNPVKSLSVIHVIVLSCLVENGQMIWNKDTFPLFNQDDLK